MVDAYNKESSFNEAYLKMERIHKAQETINNLRTNQLAFNPLYNKYNYEIIISELISLCYEVAPLMKMEENKMFKSYRKLVNDLLDYKPIHEEHKESSFEETKIKKIVNVKNWDVLSNVMLMFEDFARGQVEAHGYSSPKKKNASEAAIDL